jgi:Holliday junction DNA helicase RuvA
MIAYLKGKVIDYRPGVIILDVQNVGYKISININQTVKISEEKSYYIYEHIREDIYDLYGFLEQDEINLFKNLLSVSGIGPKAAMNIMSIALADKIIKSIETEDLSFFVNISGIGKKVAAKIILDLKSKISIDESAGVIGRSGETDNVAEALTSLGYQKSEILKVIHKIPTDVKSEEEKVRWCLKHLS